MYSQSPIQQQKRYDQFSDLMARKNQSIRNDYQQQQRVNTSSNPSIRRPLSQYKSKLEEPLNKQQNNRYILSTPQSHYNKDPKQRDKQSQSRYITRKFNYDLLSQEKIPQTSLVMDNNNKTRPFFRQHEDDPKTLSFQGAQYKSLEYQSNPPNKQQAEQTKQASLQKSSYFNSINSPLSEITKKKQQLTQPSQTAKEEQIYRQRVHTDNDKSPESTYKNPRPNKLVNPLSSTQQFNSLPSTLVKSVGVLHQAGQVNFALDPSKFSTVKNGIIRNYAAITHQGLVRNYNEDRVSIIVNVNQGNTKAQTNWPSCSYFAVYDGHGGCKCSDFLRDNLHLFVIKDENFPRNPTLAIQRGFEQAEQKFTQLCVDKMTLNTSAERSGSCSVSIMIVGDMCYVANVGDSRAILSQDGGQRVQALSRDHKPMDDIERARIVSAGGRIYQSQVQGGDSRLQKPILGPHRVFPGRLSVSRSFGDIEAKLDYLGGKAGVVIATPDVVSFKIQDNHDFVLLASDGIFDKVSNEEVVQAVWETQWQEDDKIHQHGAKAVENVMKFSIYRRTLDNITVVLVGFSNFKRQLQLNNRTKDNSDPRYQHNAQARQTKTQFANQS